jgi:DNA-binding transcriptional LysR family regulator
MTIIQIGYFLSVCSKGSVSKAADELHISQPAVSAALKDLEEECGAALFIRQSSGLVLTEEGSIFKARAEEFMEHYNLMLYSVKNPEIADKSLALGVSPMNGCVVMPKVLSNFYQRYPNVKLDIQEGGSPELIRMVMNGNIDVAIVSSVDNNNELNQFIMKRPKMVVSMHAKHPLARNKQLTIPMLAGVPIVTYYKNYAQSVMIYEAFAKYNLEPNIIYRTGQLAMVERCIKNGTSIGFLFDDIAAEINDVVSFQMDDFPPGSITMVWKKNHYLSYGARSFISFIKEWAQYL